MTMAFDDSASRSAIERYAKTIRSSAPWLPSNTNFIAQLNDLPSIENIMYDATYLVLGLGDVFLGSPCAIPLDPRHRLHGTKYNPSRSFTPRRAVGLGGQYMCIYATDSPGGYQLVGRTMEIWAAKKCGEGMEENPWLFKTFDQIKFYPISEEELDSRPAEELLRVEEGVFDVAEYEKWLSENGEVIARVKEQRKQALHSVPFFEELSKAGTPTLLTNGHSKTDGMSGLDTGETIKATVPGKCYKVDVSEGSSVKEGDALVSDHACDKVAKSEN